MKELEKKFSSVIKDKSIDIDLKRSIIILLNKVSKKVDRLVGEYVVSLTHEGPVKALFDEMVNRLIGLAKKKGVFGK